MMEQKQFRHCSPLSCKGKGTALRASDEPGKDTSLSHHLHCSISVHPPRRSLLGDAGLHVVGAESGGGLDMHDLQQVLSDKMHLDSDAAASFTAGLHLYMDDDPYKVGICLDFTIWQQLQFVLTHCMLCTPRLRHSK